MRSYRALPFVVLSVACCLTWGASAVLCRVELCGASDGVRAGFALQRTIAIRSAGDAENSATPPNPTRPHSARNNNSPTMSPN